MPRAQFLWPQREAQRLVKLEARHFLTFQVQREVDLCAVVAYFVVLGEFIISVWLKSQ